MSESGARVILCLAAIYLACGVGVAVPFVAGGIERVDRGAKGTGWGFRLLVVPGAAALWPLILARWRDARRAS